MIVGLQSLTFKCIAKVFSLKSSLEKLLTISWVIWAYIVLVKKWGKHTLKNLGSEFRGSLVTSPKLWSNPWNPTRHETVQIVACASHVVFRGLFTHELAANSPSSQIFTKLSHSNLTSNPTKNTGKWLNKNTIKFDMELKPTKNIVVNHNFTRSNKLKLLSSA